jgi:hypothetical protein
MRTILDSIIFFWKSDIEFTASLSVSTCQNRLEDLGATTYETNWFWERSDFRRIGFSLDGRGYSFFKQGPALSGELQETEEGTKISASFYPIRLYPSITVLLALLLYLVFYIKNFLFAFFIVIILVINVGSVYSFWSSWEELEGKLYKHLKSWKIGK